MAMAAEAAHRAAVTPADRDPSRLLLDKALRLADRTGSPQTAGFIGVIEGLCSLLAFDWPHALLFARAATQILDERCQGAAWERGTNRNVECTAIYQLGAWSQFNHPSLDLATLVQEARSRGDTHSLHTLAPITAWYLALDGVQVALDFVKEASSALPTDRWLLPHLQMLQTKANLALYQGDAELAWRQVASAWPRILGSRLLWIRYEAVMAYDLRGRAAVAAAGAAANAARRHEYLAEAKRFARKIERKKAPWPEMLATCIRAGAASVLGQRQEAIDRLEQGEKLARAASTSHYVAACQYRRGTLIGGSAASDLIAAAIGWAESQHVVRPDRVFGMLLPGRFGDL